MALFSVTHRLPSKWQSWLWMVAFGVGFSLLITGDPSFWLMTCQAEEWAQFSQLWGEKGELWTPQSRLPDFTFAGYRWGEESYRIPSESISVKDFGAVGDGQTDDTEAFKRAIAAGQGKLILVPEGRYVLRDILYIRSSHTVLRGAGPEKTTLIFTKPGVEIDPRPSKTDGNQPTTNWSWAGGLISIGGSGQSPRDVTRVISTQRRGDLRLTLEKNAFRPGDEILLILRDDDRNSLLSYLYRGQPGDISGLKNWYVEQVFRVVKSVGQTVLLNRPLRFDVRQEWQPTVARFTPAVTDVGVEGITFDFPLTQYAGHFKEIGFNPVEITRYAAHCWLRNLVIRNADNGPFVSGYFCTVEQIVFEADPGRLSSSGNYTGHHGVTFGRCSDCLCRDFQFNTRFIHDLTVQSSIGCVFCSGRGIDLCFDHHRWAPYENLFTDIDAGTGQRLFASSGGGMRGNHTAGGETFWCIRTQQPVRWPKSLGIDAINVVGVNLSDAVEAVPTLPSPAQLTGRWCEPIPPELLRPANLYEAMRQRAHSP
ncbi:MAG: glycosyl hydrolase family 28-related protein [Thermogutta sp.]